MHVNSGNFPGSPVVPATARKSQVTQLCRSGLRAEDFRKLSKLVTPSGVRPVWGHNQICFGPTLHGRTQCLLSPVSPVLTGRRQAITATLCRGSAFRGTSKETSSTLESLPGSLSPHLSPRAGRAPAAMVAGWNGGNGSAVCLDEGVPGFSDREAESFAIGILGDLHLEPDQMPIFERAREQLTAELVGGNEDSPARGARIIQLGDLGGYSHRPGSQACFDVAREFLGGLPVPTALVTGNHDLEGDEFETDVDNLQAWTQSFRQRHYWAAELGPAVCIGLSTVRFRSNQFSVHEVHVDEEQLRWFETALEAAADRPVLVFTHAPPLGCGLKVLQEVHVKNRCAWLNHSSTPEVFIRMVERYPNIRLWFSGHFHLSHNYVDSISTVGGCAFVQTGVIGDCNRDGFRHSRVLKGDVKGYRLFTMDHESGYLRLDLEHAWADTSTPRPVVPPEELLCDPEGDGGWLCSQLDCGLDGGEELFDPAQGRRPGRAKWYPAGPRCLMALQNGMLVEYDALHQAAIGVVFLEVGDGDEVVLVDTEGGPVPHPSTPDEDGSRTVAVELRNSFGTTLKRVERNAAGGFFTIFQQNKWRLKKAKQAAASAVAGAAPSNGTANGKPAVEKPAGETAAPVGAC